eukprot:15439263-Alexandrium_andersonii.AAC.1
MAKRGPITIGCYLRPSANVARTPRAERNSLVPRGPRRHSNGQNKYSPLAETESAANAQLEKAAV